ncbi:MAG: leucine-rich repeat domain-containing protein [Lachnospiraceae bacterium]|nr:leucine-rich repeat domain-containing protein [Lachnospiraceae bacterium]
MSKIVRRVVGILLCVTALLLIFLPSPVSNASTVRGDYEMDGSVIVKYLGNSDRVSIPNTVTEIGKDAFSGCTTISKVTIPDSVRTINYSAFENCTALTEVTLPESVRTIGSGAFSGCYYLSKINIPEKTSDLGSGVFAGCSSLSNVNISAANPYYICSDGVIYSKDGETLVEYLPGRAKSSYSMPLTIKEIGEYAFYGAYNLTDLAISPNVKTIPEYAFANCSGLTNLVIPYGVESLMAFSFADCSSLRKISIPDSVGYIDVNAFASSRNTVLDFEGQNVTPAEQGNTGNGNTGQTNTDETPSGEETGSVSDNGIEGENALSIDGNGNTIYSGDVPVYNESVLDMTTTGEEATGATYGQTKLVGGYAFIAMPTYASAKGFSMDDTEAEDDVYESNPTNVNTTPDGFVSVDSVLCDYTGNSSNVGIPSDITRIGNRAFYRDEGVETISIPGSVSDIGDFAFSRTGLNEISIPSSVDHIGYAAFYNCPYLEDINIPDSVKNIELGAFEGTPWLDGFMDEQSGEFLIVGDGILTAYNGNASVINIPEGVKSIGPQCFKKRNNLKTLRFPQSLEKICEEAFLGCEELKTVELPDSLETIEDRAFMDTGLTEVIIPARVRNIGVGAFDNTDNKPLDTVVFLGDSLPEVSCKPTASRLSAEDFRTPAFNGTKNAIVSKNADLSSPSVLSPGEYGFRGQVYTITDNNAEPGLLQLERSISVPDLNGRVTIDPHVYAGGRDYVMAGVKDSAFSDYASVYDWSGRKLTGLNIEGNQSNNLSALLSNVATSDEAGEKENGVKVFLSGDSFSGGEPSAYLKRAGSPYSLYISEEEDLRDDLVLAIQSSDRDIIIKDLIPLSIEMQDDISGINITKLATNKMEVSIPLPSGLSSGYDIRMATINDNGLCESVTAEKISENGAESLRFVISHLSPYAVYTCEHKSQSAQNGIEEKVIEVSSFDALPGGEQFNIVMQTLNKSVGGGIEIKWFVIVILFSLAFILFLWKDRTKHSKHTPRG